MTNATGLPTLQAQKPRGFEPEPPPVKEMDVSRAVSQKGEPETPLQRVTPRSVGPRVETANLAGYHVLHHRSKERSHMCARRWAKG